MLLKLLKKILSFCLESKPSRQELAMQCFKEAAHMGHVEAAFRVGELSYQGGVAVAKNSGEAIKYLTEAALKNNLKAQNLLAKILAAKSRFNVNKEDAIKWNLTALANGNDDAKRKLLYLIQKEGLAVADISANEAPRSFFLKLAATDKYLYEIAFALQSIGEEEEAFKLLSIEAKKGNSKAQIALGLLYLSSGNIERDEKAALTCFQQAASSHNTEGMYHYGCLFQQGIGVEKNEAEAVSWFRRAAESKEPNKRAQVALAKALILNDNCNSSMLKEAYQWLKKADSEIMEEARFLLSVLDKYQTKIDKLYNICSEISEYYSKKNSIHQPQSSKATSKTYHKPRERKEQKRQERKIEKSKQRIEESVSQELRSLKPTRQQKPVLAKKEEKLEQPKVVAIEPFTLDRWFQAAENGEEKTLRKLSKAPGFKDVNVADEKGETALHKAAKKGHLLAVQCLVNEMKAKTDKADIGGNLPLHLAALAGNKDSAKVIKTLINASSLELLSVINNHKETVFHCAARSGREEVVSSLLDRLQDSSEFGTAKVTEAMQQQNAKGETMLMVATGTVSKLLEKRLEQIAKKNLPIIITKPLAVEEKQSPEMQQSNASSVLETNTESLELTATKASKQKSKAATHNGKQTRGKVKRKDRSPVKTSQPLELSLVEQLMKAARENDLQKLKAILDAKDQTLTVDSRDQHEYTALMYAAKNGRQRIVTELLKRNANKKLTLSKPDERTAAELADEAGYIQLAKYLKAFKQAELTQETKEIVAKQPDPIVVTAPVQLTTQLDHQLFYTLAKARATAPPIKRQKAKLLTSAQSSAQAIATETRSATETVTVEEKIQEKIEEKILVVPERESASASQIIATETAVAKEKALATPDRESSPQAIASESRPETETVTEQKVVTAGSHATSYGASQSMLTLSPMPSYPHHAETFVYPQFVQAHGAPQSMMSISQSQYEMPTSYFPQVSQLPITPVSYNPYVAYQNQVVWTDSGYMSVPMLPQTVVPTDRIVYVPVTVLAAPQTEYFPVEQADPRFSSALVNGRHQANGMVSLPTVPFAPLHGPMYSSSMAPMTAGQTYVDPTIGTTPFMYAPTR